MVPVVGLEPTCRLAGNFKSPVYTNFTTRAMEFYFHVGIPKVCLVRIAIPVILSIYRGTHVENRASDFRDFF